MRTTMVPFTGARWLRTEMDRLFDRAWDGQDFPTFGEWAPRVDLGETAEVLTAKIEVPGIEPKDIHITLEHDILSNDAPYSDNRVNDLGAPEDRALGNDRIADIALFNA